MKLTFTKHAVERMKERGITVGEVARVLAYGKPRETRVAPVWSVDPRRVPDDNWAALLARLCVVCTSDLRVVTAYRK